MPVTGSRLLGGCCTATLDGQSGGAGAFLPWATLPTRRSAPRPARAPPPPPPPPPRLPMQWQHTATNEKRASMTAFLVALLCMLACMLRFPRYYARHR